MEKIIIAAVTDNNVIGIEGKIPWHSTEELKHFKKTTFGFPILMGRKTFESINKSLEGRVNIVISKTKSENYDRDDILVFNSLEKAYIFCEENLKADKIYIIGGANIFEQTINVVDKMLISRMKRNYEGDVFFPDFPVEDWNIESTKNYNDFELITYKRKVTN